MEKEVLIQAQTSQIALLSERVASLEAKLVKSGSYKDIIAAVEAAVQSVNIEPALQTRLNQFISGAIRSTDTRAELSRMTRDLATTMAGEVNDRMVTLLVENYEFQERVTRGLVGRDLNNTITRVAKEVVGERITSDPTILSSAMRGMEPRIVEQLATSATLRTALLEPIKVWWDNYKARREA